MICLLPTLHCGGSLPPCLHQTPPLLGERRKRPRPRRLARRHKRQHPLQCHISCREAATPYPRRAAALPSSSSQAYPRRPRISAEPMKHPIPIGRTIAGSSGILRPLPLHRRLSAVYSGARYRRATHSGRFRERNLVGLRPQSKCFFSYQECGPLMTAPASLQPGGCLIDRIAS